MADLLPLEETINPDFDNQLDTTDILSYQNNAINNDTKILRSCTYCGGFTPAQCSAQCFSQSYRCWKCNPCVCDCFNLYC